MPHENETDLFVSVWGSFAEACAGSSLPQGQGHWQHQSWEAHVGISPLGLISPPYNRAYRLQDWVFSGQTTNKEGAQPHPSAGNWIKDLLSMALSTSSVQLLSHVQLFATPWTAACQASLSSQLPEFTQTHVCWVGDAIQPSYHLSSPSPPAFNLSQHQDLFKWVGPPE